MMFTSISTVTLSDGSHYWLIPIPRWYLRWLYTHKPRLISLWCKWRGHG
jgi:hypothetical protein